MNPKIAFIIGLSFVVFVFMVVERRRNAPVSSALFWPLFWYILVSSRSVAVWLQVMGIPIFGGADGDGNIIDRSVFFVLCVIGIYVLRKRAVDWTFIRRENRWLILLFLCMFVSILWSDYTWISCKRLVKSFAALVMVFVVLTENDPFSAIETVIRRAAYLLIPMSIIVIKYFRSIGVEYDWTGTGMAWKGLATSKNTLGQVVMVCTLYFVWSIVRDWRIKRPWRWVEFVYLGMCIHLIKGPGKAVSVTSLSVCGIGLLLFAIAYKWRRKPRILARVLNLCCGTILSLPILLFVHTMRPFANDSPFGVIIRTLGRDLTLSGRTGIWSDVLAIASQHPLFGAGYGGFWIGRVANIPWDTHLSWVLGEGHNGYFDAYLQIGIIGVLLLYGVILASRRGIIALFPYDFEYATFRMTFLIIILFVNITESTFLRGEHSLWFIFLLSTVSVPLVKITYGDPLLEDLTEPAAAATAA